MEQRTEPRPFLKWAGGKKQILGHILAMVPDKINTYYEPFVGGGAVFFALAVSKRFCLASLNDANQELIDCYRAVQKSPKSIVNQLRKWSVDESTFYEVRNKIFGRLTQRAARTIYLNKTGYNGLYRVNKKGQFNVPFGKWAHLPKVVDPANLQACSNILNENVTLSCQDFSEAVLTAGPGDVVYFDPPYVPLSKTSNFRDFTSRGFTSDDQFRLVSCFRKLVDRGVRVIASNSNTEVVRSLYEGFEMREVRAKRCINSKGDQRGPIKELIIVGG